MSTRPTWRQRYARHRRYGLDPLPDDASQQQREQRAVELRERRRRRRIRYAMRSGGGVLALALLAVALLGWLFTTVSGRDVLLARIVAALPANASLTWLRAEGPARGPLSLHGVRFTWATCADEDRPVNATFATCKDRRTTLFTAKTVTLNPSILYTHFRFKGCSKLLVRRFIYTKLNVFAFRL